MKSLIVSRKFNFGHISGLLAWNDMLKRLGHSTFFYADPQYLPHLNKCSFVGEEDFSNDYDLIIIFNLSTEDGRLVSKIKKNNRNTKVIFIYHEPWRGLLYEIKRFKRDIIRFIKQVGRKFYSRKVLKLADLVICPSSEAVDFYSRHESKYNNNYIRFPLVFLDAASEGFDKKKKYFSFISTASQDKGADIFFKFIEYAARRDNDVVFQVVTPSDATKYLNNYHFEMVRAGRLIIRHKAGLNEEEMDDAYNNSRCTWLVYRSSTQSGVIAKAFMWGSPCLATKVGVFPTIINGKNGLLVDDAYNFEDILEKFHQICENENSFQESARQSFLENYDSKNRCAELSSIIETLMKVND